MMLANVIATVILVYLWIKWVQRRRANDIRMIEVTLPDESFNVNNVPAAKVD